MRYGIIKKKKKIHLVRDSMGIKPMYLAKVPEGFIFIHEIKALKKVCEFFKKKSHKTVFLNFLLTNIFLLFFLFLKKCSNPGQEK